MHKKILVGVLLLSPVSIALADPDIGCGLGTQLWEGTEGGAIPRALGATTNGTSGNQTFGISSGTSGCNNDGAITASARLPVYADANFDQLAKDMSRGQGESLTTLASLYGISADDQGAFFSVAKDRYGDIFTHSGITATEMLRNLNAVMASVPALSRYAS
jgi:hypothetical protein